MSMLIFKDVFIINLAKKGKNPAQLSSEDNKFIIGIAIQISIKIDDILKMAKFQEDSIEKLLISSSNSKENILNMIITSMVLQNDKDLLYLPIHIKNKVIEILSSLGNESSKIYSYDISKKLKEMERDGVTLNIKTKKEIKNLGFSKDFKNKKSEAGGYPSIYIPSPNIKEYKRILNNPNAIDKINQLLKEYAKLDQFYSLICRSCLKMMITNPDELRKSLELMNKSIGSPLDSTEANFSNWNSIIEGAKLLSEKETKDLCTNFVNNTIDNPNSFVFICFIIDPK